MKETNTHQSTRADSDKMLLREVDGWVHHAADLDRRSKVRTVELKRPIGLAPRFAAVKDFVGAVSHFSPGLLAIAERLLTPRAPYQPAPLSYLNAWGRSWSLWAEANRLEWAEFGSPGGRSGPLEFWFRNVTPGSMALVTIDLTVGVTGPGVNGSFELRSSAAAPRQFPVTGFQKHIVDVVVRPSEPFAVLVTLNPGPGIGYLAFERAEYQTL